MQRREGRERTRQIVHLPRDDFELSLKYLIFAYDIPDANWRPIAPRFQDRLRDEEVRVMAGGGRAYLCQKCQPKRNSIP